jgi:hypothetical protein
VGQAAWCGAGIRWLKRRKWLFSWNGKFVGTIDRNFYIGNVLQKLHINRYKIIALQRSRPRKLTSWILALSEVKAIILSGRYTTRLGTVQSSYLGWLT